MMLSDIFLTRFLTDVVHLNHPETSQRRFAPTPDHFTGISGPLHWNTQQSATQLTCSPESAHSGVRFSYSENRNSADLVESDAQ